MPWSGHYAAPLDGGMASDPELRLLHVVFGVKGACDNCLPRRRPARCEVWESVVGPEMLASLADEQDPEPAPHSVRSWLCADCTLDVREDASDECYVARIFLVPQA